MPVVDGFADQDVDEVGAEGEYSGNRQRRSVQTKELLQLSDAHLTTEPPIPNDLLIRQEDPAAGSVDGGEVGSSPPQMRSQPGHFLC